MAVTNQQTLIWKDTSKKTLNKTLSMGNSGIQMYMTM